MNPYVNEDVMFQRLKDVQREAENRRLTGAVPSALDLAARLGRLLWSRVRLTLARPRPQPVPDSVDDQSAVSDVA